MFRKDASEEQAVAAPQQETVRNSGENRRSSSFMDYATVTRLAIGLLETAFAIEDNCKGI